MTASLCPAIFAIIALCYRGPVTAAPTTTGWCTDVHFDAVSPVDDSDVTYAFRGDECAKLNDYGMEAGYPRAISSEFPGLPDDLDAAFYWPNSSSTYFFKGTQYWRYRMRAISDGYPRSIATGFPGIPTNIDAAFVYSGNGQMYFTKGDQYYNYDAVTGVDTFHYPKDLEVWVGLPDRVDAALQYKNGRTYFFAGPNFYRFNNRLFSTDAGFPRLTSVYWLGCSDTSGNVAAASMEWADDQFMESGFE